MYLKLTRAEYREIMSDKYEKRRKRKSITDVNEEAHKQSI